MGPSLKDIARSMSLRLDDIVSEQTERNSYCSVNGHLVADDDDASWDCSSCAGATMQQYNSAGHVQARAMHERPEPQNRIPRFRTLAVCASSANAHALRRPRLPPHSECDTRAEATMVQFCGASRSRCHPGGCPIRSLRVCPTQAYHQSRNLTYSKDTCFT